MILRGTITGLAIAVLVFAGSAAWAHTPLMLCMDNGDNSVTCQGGFSDGSSAAGVIMRIKAPDGRVLQEGRMDDSAEFSFMKPRGDFLVVFDAGPEHQLRVPGRQIGQ
ncbi:MAG: hypothetical protein EA399_15260 [Desulfovibrionales bacterium]|nr:MAG: hypothetical protein EA399_15260 [Desulfovibrionales bacterium]